MYNVAVVKMVVLDRFYQIADRDSTRVSIFWKAAHVTIFIGAAVCGFLTAFTFGQVLDDFNYNCVLNAKVVFDNNTNVSVEFHGHSEGKTTPAIALTETTWGPSTECNFVQFTPLFTMLAAVIWGTFFIILARGGGGYSSDLLSRPWTIIYPCLLFTVITIITSAVSTLKLKQGLTAFCTEFKPIFGNDECIPAIECYIKQFHHGTNERRPLVDFCVNEKLAVLTAEIGLWLWVVQLVILVARVVLVVDFDLYLVTIIPKDEEYIEKIIEPIDPDDNTSEV